MSDQWAGRCRVEGARVLVSEAQKPPKWLEKGYGARDFGLLVPSGPSARIAMLSVRL